MNPSLLIIGSLALNFHHYNIQSNQKKYKPIRTINDLDLIVSSDFLDFLMWPPSAPTAGRTAAWFY